MDHPDPARRRRIWPVLVPVVLVIALAILWTSLWFYAASAAETAIAGWREREAKVGRLYSCQNETIGGYPFRIEVRCSEPAAELRDEQPPLALKAMDLLVVAQVYQPTLLIGEFTGPLTIAEAGRPPAKRAYVARFGPPSDSRSWSMARPSIASAKAAMRPCSRRSGSSCTAAWPRARPRTIR
jgi:hypothetical protein